MSHQLLNEGLRPMDLSEMVYPLFEIDTYSSKMGEDRDVCVLSFHVKDRSPAKDLMEFIEKGYPFVLDADVSSGENEKGEYSVFVELSRSDNLSEEINEIIYGIQKLTGLREFKFKYHKEQNIHEATSDNFLSVIPQTASDYDGLLVKRRTDEIKQFFNKTLMDDLTVDYDLITIFKPFGSQIKLRMISEESTDAILENTTDPFSVDQDSMSEIFWLTKVLGNYNINKIGEGFVFENNGQTMILQRIE